MKRCAVYARVSTDMQGESLENQVEYAQEYVRRLGEGYQLEPDCVYTDFDQSGYYTRFLQRPAIQRALADAKQGRYDVIVFKEISRISRDQAEHVEIVSRFTQVGVRMIAINDNLDSDRPETLDLLGIHSVMSEMESKRISSRVSSGKKMLARRGVWTGEAPIGYRLNPDLRQLEIDPLHAETPKIIFRLFTEEGLGTLKIAEYLNAREIWTKNGRPWSRGTVRQVLQNPAYVGDLVYGKTRNALKRIYNHQGYSKVQSRNALPEEDWIVVHDTHAPLISHDMFTRAERIRSARAKQNPRKSRHPLTGLLICDCCGAGMVCQQQRYRGKTYRYYTCGRRFRFGRIACEQPNLPAEKLEQAVWQHVMEQLHACGDAVVIVTAKRTALRDLQRQQQQLQHSLQKAQSGLARLLTDEDLPTESYTQLKEHFIATIRTAEAQLAAMQIEMADAAQAEEPHTLPFSEVLQRLERLDGIQLDTLRSLFHSLIRRITIHQYDVREISLRYRLFSFIQ